MFTAFTYLNLCIQSRIKLNYFICIITGFLQNSLLIKFKFEVDFMGGGCFSVFYFAVFSFLFCIIFRNTFVHHVMSFLGMPVAYSLDFFFHSQRYTDFPLLFWYHYTWFVLLVDLNMMCSHFLEMAFPFFIFLQIPNASQKAI